MAGVLCYPQGTDTFPHRMTRCRTPPKPSKTQDSPKIAYPVHHPKPAPANCNRASRTTKPRGSQSTRSVRPLPMPCHALLRRARPSAPPRPRSMSIHRYLRYSMTEPQTPRCRRQTDGAESCDPVTRSAEKPSPSGGQGQGQDKQRKAMSAQDPARARRQQLGCVVRLLGRARSGAQSPALLRRCALA